MSTRHALDGEGAVVCEASPRDDGSNVTSNMAGVNCPDCLELADYETWMALAPLDEVEEHANA